MQDGKGSLGYLHLFCMHFFLIHGLIALSRIIVMTNFSAVPEEEVPSCIVCCMSHSTIGGFLWLGFVAASLLKVYCALIDHFLQH